MSGLKAINVQGGGSSNSRLDRYKIKSGYATELISGDPVVRLADGTIGKAGVSTKGILGSFVGWRTDDSEVLSERWVANTTTGAGQDADAFVDGDPDAEFVITADGALAQTNIGNNASFVFGSNDTFNNVSGAELDASTAAADANGDLPLKIKGAYDRPGNDLTDSKPRVVVTINNHGKRYAPGV